MAMNTILLESAGVPQLNERSAVAAITPGDFLERSLIGSYQRQSTAGQPGPKLVALEQDLIGQGIDDDYAVGESVRAVYATPGNWIYAFVPAGAAAIVVGDDLQFDGTGCLIKAVAGTVVATSLQDVNNSAGASKARIEIEMV